MDYLQIIGYVALGIIALSMVFNSFVKFRWVNMIGAGIFAAYGFLIEAYPVALLNTFIFSVDVYFLMKIYFKKEQFKVLEIKSNNQYLFSFLEFHQKDIQKFFPGFEYQPEMNTVSFFILRDMAVAGVFLAHKTDENTIKVGLDFVIKEYRDYKNARFVYHRLNPVFIEQGIENFIVLPQSFEHIKYLRKMGFVKDAEGWFYKSISEN
jgi:hypothetical protein